MPQLKQFLLPDIGEGLTEGEIVTWMVKPGDVVTDGQPIVEVETAKVTVELPCPFDGVVAELHARAGETVEVGAPIVTIRLDAADEPTPVDAPAPAVDGPGTSPPSAYDAMVPELPHADGDGPEDVMLVGRGPKTGARARRARRRPEVASGTTSEAIPDAVSPTVGLAVLARPPVRKLAKDLGVDLGAVTGSGDGGIITRADVESAASRSTPERIGAASPAAFGPDREARIPIKGLRKHTAAAMVQSAFTAPHVSEFLSLDITPTMELRERVAELTDFAGVRVSPLLFVARAVLIACRRHPMMNSTWDEKRGEIVVKDYVNLGIATATDRGLIVPNIKDAGRLTLRELAAALGALTAAARAGSVTAADLAGGTISITNVGIYGVDTGTPILPPGETAILALGAVRDRPWVVDGAVVPRKVTTLALSFDHRIVDGQLGSQFLADIGAMLSDPGTALAWS
ncbi:MAG: dihydrolipoamide acetyltransferase family protein [Mycobacteriales bacterium]